MEGAEARHVVLFVTSMHPSPAFPLRGKIIQRQADAIRALGHRVEFVELGVEGGPLRYLQARPAVAAAVERIKPDVIHVHFGYSGLAVPRVPIPIVSSFYGDDLNGTADGQGGRTLKSRMGVGVSQYVAARSSRCIVVSASLRDRMWTRGLRAKTVVVRDAVDPKLFRPLNREEARARLGLPLDDILVIFPHAADVPTKRLWLAEEALSVLRQDMPAARLWVVNGRPPDDMPWYYAAADAMVVTSALEGGPSSAKESLACGIPVVSVEVGDLQLFEDAVAGMIRAPATADGIARGLALALRETPPIRGSFLPAELTLARAAKATIGVYDDVVGQRQRVVRQSNM